MNLASFLTGVNFFKLINVGHPTSLVLKIFWTSKCIYVQLSFSWYNICSFFVTYTYCTEQTRLGDTVLL